MSYGSSTDHTGNIKTKDMGVSKSKRNQKRALTRIKANELAGRVSLKKAKQLKKEAKRAPHIAKEGKARRMTKAVTRKAYKIKKRQSKK